MQELGPFTEPITGWRLWQVVPSGQHHGLAAWSTRRLLWPARRRCESYCLSGGPSVHRAPEPGCRCGVYAFATRELAEQALVSEMRPIPTALGRVSLWGQVVQHARGWRAQYAYPYDLWLLHGSQSLAGDLRAAYAIDVDLLNASELVRRVRAERRRQFLARSGRGDDADQS
jgi:hypothetical protein